MKKKEEIEYSINILARFDDLKWAEKLYDGEVFMRTLRGFREGTKEGFSDAEEGMILKLDNAKILYGNKTLGIAKDVKVFYGSNYPILCFFELRGYKINEKLYRCIIPERLITEFSKGHKKPVLFGIPREPFLQKLKAVTDEMKLDFYAARVKYSDSWSELLQRPWENLYRKRESYKYQQEFRVVLFEDCDAPYKTLNIGSLRDVAGIIPLYEKYSGGDLTIERELPADDAK